MKCLAYGGMLKRNSSTKSEIEIVVVQDDTELQRNTAEFPV